MSSASSSSSSSSGPGALILLGVLFVGLKLTHVIDWSWWYVTLPFWALPIISLLIFLSAIVLLYLNGEVRIRKARKLKKKVEKR